MRVLVTGAEGFVGREACRLAGEHHRVMACGRPRLDIQDPRAVDRVFEQFRPRLVLHCAAYTDVDGAEGRLASAMAVNAQGTANVARSAARVQARMLYLSTDYVFDGAAQRPYVEDDDVAPLSDYARSKLEGERLVGETCPRYAIVRTGWLYGSGKGFVDWVVGRLAGTDTVELVEDQWGSPTWVTHLAQAMVLAGELELQGLFHVVNKGIASWYEIGRRIAQRSGGADAVERLRPISHAALGRPAARPRFSPLDVGRFEGASGVRLATWEEALDEYLRARRE